MEVKCSVSEPLKLKPINRFRFSFFFFFLIWFGFFSSRSVFSLIFFRFDFQTDLHYVQIKKEKKLNMKRKILVLINYYDLTFYVVQENYGFLVPRCLKGQMF